MPGASGIKYTSLIRVFCSFYFQHHHRLYPLTAKIAGAPQMISQPVSSIFPCSPLPSGTWRTPGVFILWCCLSTLFLCLVSALFYFIHRQNGGTVYKQYVRGKVVSRTRCFIRSNCCFLFACLFTIRLFSFPFFSLFFFSLFFPFSLRALTEKMGTWRKCKKFCRFAWFLDWCSHWADGPKITLRWHCSDMFHCFGAFVWI